MIPRILLSLFLFSSYALGAPRTNVLFLIVDDLNTHLGCYGNPTVKSPHIDRLAAKGVRFDQAYCQYALCHPSRVSLLSGKRPETSGVYDLATKARDIFPQAIMLPELFRENGYFCAGAGKVHHGENHKDDRSWDFYSDQPGKDAGETAAIHERYRGGNGTPKPCILESDGSQTRDGLNVRKIAAFIEDCAERNQPFFLAAGFHKPHLPWTAPKRFYDLYPADSIPVPAEPPMQNVPEVALQTELSGFAAPTSSTEAVRGYYACISFTDSNLGLLLETLDRRNLWANTLVVLVSDNGFHLGDHNGLWSKLTTFENGTRVPLLMAGAGLPEGKVVQHPVELVDIYPTLAELAGLAAPAGLEGKSLVPALRSQTVDPDARAYSMIYHYDPATRSDILGRSVRTREFRYTEWSNSRQDRELYLPGGPAGEFRNLAGQALLQQEQGAKYLSEHVFPKPGVANRPRALLPSGKSGKE
jgi:iduronate 2-sulfatase